jgi:hypothetical protein
VTPPGESKSVLSLTAPNKHIKLLLDVKKAFEHVQRNQLIKEAVVNDYLMAEALASITAYTWPKYITCEGVLTEPIIPRRGIAACSAFATFELWCILRSARINLQAAHPMSTLCLHVDDLCLTAKKHVCHGNPPVHYPQGTSIR